MPTNMAKLDVDPRMLIALIGGAPGLTQWWRNSPPPKQPDIPGFGYGLGGADDNFGGPARSGRRSDADFWRRYYGPGRSETSHPALNYLHSGATKELKQAGLDYETANTLIRLARRGLLGYGATPGTAVHDFTGRALWQSGGNPYWFNLGQEGAKNPELAQRAIAALQQITTRRQGRQFR